MSDQQLAHLFSAAPKLHKFGGSTIVRLSKSFATKGGRSVSLSEAKSMVFAADSLKLPVPRVHRTFSADIPIVYGSDELTKGHFIVMDYIPGPTVEECWSSLDEVQRQSVVDQLAGMIEKMQSTILELPPGPIGRDESDKSRFKGPWFTDEGAGPFSTLQELENWCNHKIDVCVKFKQLSRRAPRFKFKELVLTHQDIAPRNLILDARNKVWMIDWGLAGAYPPGFEQAVFEGQSWQEQDFTDMVLGKLSNRQENITKQFKSIGYGLSVAKSH